MRVLLAGPDYEENLSIRYVSASLLSAGHETVLAAFNSPADIISVANAVQRAGIVGLSMCFQSRAQEFLRLAQLIRSRDPKKLIVAGGHYASCAAEPLLANHPEIDIIVIHEGERTLVEIADAMPNLEERLSQIPGIAYRNGHQICFSALRPALDDLDSLPYPDLLEEVIELSVSTTSGMNMVVSIFEWRSIPCTVFGSTFALFVSQSQGSPVRITRRGIPWCAVL